METTNQQRVYISGDNHGKYDTMFRFIEAYNIKDCILIHVGDGGIGFISAEKQKRQFEHYNDRFKSKGIEYLSIRGNHDDPAYFDGSVNLSNFKLLPDYHTQIIDGEKFLFVGGAISIDRQIRKEGFSYWKDEPFVLDKSKIEECDVLITHSAPTWLGEFTKQGILSWCEKDEFLWRDCVKERDDLAMLYELAKPKKAFCGHFHCSVKQEYNGCVATILHELEIVEYRQ